VAAHLELPPGDDTQDSETPEVLSSGVARIWADGNGVRHGADDLP
jgi:hypothetical protein